MTKHAKLSPSAAHRWMNCPGSVKLCEGIPDEESEYAALGTFAHDVAARCLDHGRNAESYIGHTDMIHEVDAEMAGYITEYLDTVRSVIEPRSTLLVEQRVMVTPDVWGTADAIVVTCNVLHVFDLKYGAGIFVDVVNNPQLLIYALGAAVKATPLGAVPYVKTVVVHVVQPRHRSCGHHQSSLHYGDLLAWGNDVLRPGIKRVLEARAPLAAGDHCRFCDAKVTCPEIRKTALTAAQDLFDGNVADLVPSDTAPDPALLKPGELASALAAFPIIETWMKAVREHAYKVAGKGTEIPGYKLVQKVGNRKWKDEAAVASFFDLFDFDPYAKPKLLSPAQMEKTLPKADRSVMAALTHKPDSGTALVPNSDKRPAKNAAAVFETLPSDETQTLENSRG